jgi:ribosomal-protein-alanine N-acetyltransferase
MQPVTIRHGIPNDLPALHRLDVLCFEPPFRFDFHTMRRFAREPGSFTLVAEAPGWQLCGFVILSLWRRRRQPPIGYVVTLDVAPERRQQGIASQLMAAAEEQVRAAGGRTMRLHVYAENQPALRFYQSAGYLPLETVPDFYGSGVAAFLYGKDLPG